MGIASTLGKRHYFEDDDRVCHGFRASMSSFLEKECMENI
jgi:hypothetical protein